MSVLDRARDLTGRLIQSLETVTGRRFYDLRVPDNDPVMPYGLVIPIGGGGYSGPPLVAPDEMMERVYQVDAVGLQRHQAEWMADAVRAAVLGRGASGAFIHPIQAPAGWKVVDRRSVDGVAGIVVEGRVVTASARYLFIVTPEG